jgi:hypothetical protein
MPLRRRDARPNTTFAPTTTAPSTMSAAAPLGSCPTVRVATAAERSAGATLSAGVADVDVNAMPRQVSHR